MKKTFVINAAGNGVHVGEMLKHYIRKNKVFKSVLARKIKRSDSSVLQFQKRNTIQISILLEICHALKYNFFRDIAEKLPSEYGSGVIIDTSKDERIAALETEVALLRAEKEILVRVMKSD